MDAGEPIVAHGQADTAADALLAALHRHGVDYFFANAGTDFPPLIEGFARAAQRGAKVPRPVLVPHENAAVAMAHGVYMVSGRPQAVMVHVNVGTGNTINTLINAARDNVPLLLMAGRSPVTETGHRGSRSRFIHWAQEMFDQAAMVREIVKWDYELRMPDQVDDVVARAFESMMTAPRGPAYLTLPREIVAAAAKPSGGATRRALPVSPQPDPAAIAELAGWIATAARPLLITAGAGRTALEVECLGRLSERFAIPAVSFNRRYMSLPSAHPMNLGYQPRPLLDEADLVIVLDCDVPWIASLERPPAGCRVAHIAEDPGFLRYPVRSFPVDLSIAAATAPALAALETALTANGVDRDERVTARRDRLGKRSAALRTQWAGEAAVSGRSIKPEFLSRAIGDAVGAEAIIVNEYPLRVEHCPRDLPGTYFGLSPAGGLGWGLGAALGAKLAAPERLVVATVGDGAYVFANPTACHWVSATQDLPILTIVFNNAAYGAVRNSTLAMYRDGAAAGEGAKLLADLSPSPAFEQVVAASGGHGERVDDPAELPAALARAIAVVTKERRQALLNVICTY
jgi:acetolactate synthase-1/2/3 large subunit